MPVRTVTEEFCDVCYTSEPPKETAASDRLRFGWQGKNYVVLACAKHVGKIRDDLQRLSEIGSIDQESRRPGGAAARSPRSASRREGSRATLFSELSREEKERFRAWADLPNARRIADSRVEAWTEAGKP